MFAKRSLDQYIIDVERYFTAALQAEQAGNRQVAEKWLMRAIELEAQALA